MKNLTKSHLGRTLSVLLALLMVTTLFSLAQVFSNTQKKAFAAEEGLPQAGKFFHLKASNGNYLNVLLPGSATSRGNLQAIYSDIEASGVDIQCFIFELVSSPSGIYFRCGNGYNSGKVFCFNQSGWGGLGNSIEVRNTNADSASYMTLRENVDGTFSFCDSRGYYAYLETTGTNANLIMLRNTQTTATVTQFTWELVNATKLPAVELALDGAKFEGTTIDFGTIKQGDALPAARIVSIKNTTQAEGLESLVDKTLAPIYIGFAGETEIPTPEGQGRDLTEEVRPFVLTRPTAFEPIFAEGGNYTRHGIATIAFDETKNFTISIAEGLVEGTYEEIIHIFNSDIGIIPITLKFEVAEPMGVKSLAITNQPTKTSYFIGDKNIDLTGLVVTAIFEDDSSEIIDIAKCTISGFNTTSGGEKNITVTYRGKSATFTINVVITTLRILITEEPEKIDYFVGDKNIDLTGLVVTVVFSDNTSRVLTSSEYTIDGFDTSAEGNVIITVTHDGKTATFEINVEAKVKKGCGGATIGGGYNDFGVLFVLLGFSALALIFASKKVSRKAEN